MSMKSLMLTAAIGLSSLTLASGVANAGTYAGSPGGYFGPIYTNVYSDGPGRSDRDRYDKRRSSKRDHEAEDLRKRRAYFTRRRGSAN